MQDNTQDQYFNSEKELSGFLDSLNKKAPLVRPKISKIRLFLNLTIPPVVCVLWGILLWQLGIIFCLIFAIPAAILFFYIILRLKSIFIWVILVYQAVAPEHIRRRCVFTPTCSSYAIQALKKYGFLRGFIKIIKRLRRCKPPNGGNDPLE